MDTPHKKHFYIKNLPDEVHQKLVEATEQLEDKIFDFIEGQDVNLSIFALSSATARIIGSIYARSPTVDDDDIKIVIEDFGIALTQMYHAAKKYNSEME